MLQNHMLQQSCRCHHNNILTIKKIIKSLTIRQSANQNRQKCKVLAFDNILLFELLNKFGLFQPSC